MRPDQANRDGIVGDRKGLERITEGRLFKLVIDTTRRKEFKVRCRHPGQSQSELPLGTEEV